MPIPIEVSEQIFTSTQYCSSCGKCFCSVTKLRAADGAAVCHMCIENYQKQLVQKYGA